MTRGRTFVARQEVLRMAYAAYNEQDADGLGELLSDDVDWPDGSAGRLHGCAAVRAYWLDQWTRTRTHDEPLDFTDGSDGQVAVRLDQIVRALDGSVISTGQFVYVFQFEGELISGLEIQPA